MFERVILSVIHALKGITKNMEEAYFDTDAFSDDELTREFENTVEAIRFKNKSLYIQQAAIFVGKKTLQEEGYIITPKKAIAIAENMFELAVEEGKIDELNNTKE